jgi:uncharacterized membrane protein
VPAAFHSFDPRGAGVRMVLAAIAGVIAWFVVPSGFALVTRALVAWDVAAVVLLAIAAVIIVRSTASETKRRAASEDPGRTLVWILVLAASAFSMFAAAIVLHQTKTLSRAESDLHLALCVAAVVMSWLLAHTAFTLRYAHLYYRGEPEQVGGIEFPGDRAPDDLDFAYFAFTIGMCFQVSDSSVTDRLIRRTVLAHALIAFAFNTVILAFSLNVLFNQFA